jgi:tetraacyldisaccharide 4'-kinase
MSESPVPSWMKPLFPLTMGMSCIYSAIMRCRNAMYDGGVLKSHSLGKPTISVGNITSGGTGKTPVVRWLAERLLSDGYRPAILMRGYRSDVTGFSDERELLAGYLPDVPVIANPDRIAGAADALARNPPIDTFILDDGMQHRRARRDVNLVLVHAADPFSNGWVLPCGLLREPLAGLSRADAFLLTHADEVDSAAIDRIRATLSRFNPNAPIYLSDHALESVRSTDGAMNPIASLRARRVFIFSGIASPESFSQSIQSAGVELCDAMAFGDHHIYTPADWLNIQSKAQQAKADVIVTTQKDWVKVARIIGDQKLTTPIFVAELSLRFHDDHAEQLVNFIRGKLTLPAQ